MNFFVDDSTSKFFTNLQDVVQIAFHVIKNRKSYRFFSLHDLESQPFTSLFNQFIDFDFFDFSARQPSNIDFDDLKYSIDFSSLDIKTRQFFANFLDARRFFNLDRSIDFDKRLSVTRFSADLFKARQFSRSSKRHRFIKIINSVKKQIVQFSILKKTNIFFTTSTKLIDFLYSRMITQKTKQKCNAFSKTYNRFLNVMNKNKHDDFF